MVVEISAVAAQLCHPFNAYRAPLDDGFQKKVLDIMLHLEAEWPSKQNILIVYTILEKLGP